MEPNPEDFGIKIYTAPPNDPTQIPSSDPRRVLKLAGKGEQLPRECKKPYQKLQCLSSPTGTLLTFEMFSRPRWQSLLWFVTPKGLAVFKTGLGAVEVPKDEKYKVGFTDFVHAMMSVMVFVAIAFSDHRVTNCLFPGHANDMDEVMESFPLMVGIICSSLFLVFPNTRFGVGCMAA
ncbi:hypothetical protein SLA2020_338350 [Shorea laevis]